MQTVVPASQISIATSLIVASQSLGGAVFVSVGNTILQNQLLHSGTATLLATIDVSEVIHAGATRFRTIVPAALLDEFLVLYNAALQKVFLVAVGCAGLGFVASLGLEWNSVKEVGRRKEEGGAGAEEKV